MSSAAGIETFYEAAFIGLLNETRIHKLLGLGGFGAGICHADLLQRKTNSVGAVLRYIEMKTMSTCPTGQASKRKRPDELLRTFSTRTTEAFVL
jgi:hypothetical protein